MGKETLYRFELAFRGDPWDVGFLQGLTEVQMPLSVQDELYGYFDSLPVPPMLCTEDDSPLSCWFTERGLAEFAESINNVIYVLSCEEWQLIGKSVCIDTAFALYSDEYQAIFSRSDLLELLFPDMEEYRTVSCIEPGQKEPLVFCSKKPPLEEKIQKAQLQEKTNSSGFRQQEAER